MLVVAARVAGALILLSGASVLGAVALGHLRWAMRLDPHAQHRTRADDTLQKERERDQPGCRAAE
jgi:hypothetical protein